MLELTPPAIARGSKRDGTMAREPVAPRHGRGLACLSLEDGLAPAFRFRLEALARLPYVEDVLALPDLHQKPDMEVPSSLAIRTRDVLVPEFTSVAVNDGMGVITTDLDAADMTPERIREFFTHIGVHASAHPMEANRYSLSTTDLHAALLGGARAATRRYGLPESWATRMEDDGCITSWPDGDPRVGESIPRLMLRSSATRSEMGLNFGGNHFLELQAVDRIVDAETAARWGLRAGQLVVMYHLGPGTFGGTLLHHLSRRLKTSRERVPVYFTAKLLFHYLQRARQGRLWDKWGLHFRRNEFTAIPAESDAGKLFRRALTMATNVGSAYRMATVRAVLDGLASAITPGVRAELLCDISHNGIHQDADAGGHLWTARHNACRLVAGAPTIVAGSSDVPSYLGLGDSGHGEQLIDSYDHGAGHLIELARGTADATPADGHVLRVRMDRGRNARVLSTQRVPMRSAGPIERLMECFEAHRAMRPVVRLRPIATLKN